MVLGCWICFSGSHLPLNFPVEGRKGAHSVNSWPDTVQMAICHLPIAFAQSDGHVVMYGLHLFWLFAFCTSIFALGGIIW